MLKINCLVGAKKYSKLGLEILTKNLTKDNLLILFKI